MVDIGGATDDGYAVGDPALTTFIFVAAFCVVAVLVYMARYSGRVRVEQTRLIDAPLDVVYARVVDLGQWQQWNPWMEPGKGAALTLSDRTDQRGSTCIWTSETMGSGMVEHVRVVASQRIEQRLRLKHPFTVSGRSFWTFSVRSGKTEVTWNVRGRVAFSMRAFSSTVKSSLALDCRYGLDQLASLMEPDSAPCYSIAHLGVRDIAAQRYVYSSYQGPISGLSQAMASALTELRQVLTAHGLEAAGMPMAIYFKTNIKLRTTVCHIGIPIDGALASADLPVRELAAHRAYVVRLQGSPQALEIAWYLAMQRMVADKIQPDQRIPPCECYLVSDGGRVGNDSVTELHLPVLPPR